MDYLNTLFNLKDKVAVITGGSGVLAGEMANGILKLVAKLIPLDLQKESLDTKTTALSKFGFVAGMVCDVLDKSKLEAIRERIINHIPAKKNENQDAIEVVFE